MIKERKEVSIGENICSMWGEFSNKLLSTKLGTINVSNTSGEKEAPLRDACNTCITCHITELGGALSKKIESHTGGVTGIEIRVTGTESHTNEGSYPRAHFLKDATTMRVRGNKSTDIRLQYHPQ